MPKGLKKIDRKSVGRCVGQRVTYIAPCVPSEKYHCTVIEMATKDLVRVHFDGEPSPCCVHIGSLYVDIFTKLTADDTVDPHTEETG